MQCRSRALLVSLLAVASASPCKPRPASSTSASATTTPTLPLTGTGSELSAANSSLSLLKIAIGHGLQNYTCLNSSAAVKAPGALAVLYDVTDLYPGMSGSSLIADVFDALTTTLIWNQDIPLNLQNSEAANPGTPAVPNAMAESLYGAVVGSPFPSPAAALSLPTVLPASIPFLGHHYFDSAGSPTFDLSAAGLLGSMAKASDVTAPSTAEKGPLGTGAVDWLELKDNGRGISQGISQVFRVMTAGGVSETCNKVDAATGSVPYTAFYWFYG
ncbi:malate dehydrogenase [Grosmannia clavigera kw1407]|uniref:Malate dehydrogenase n=1 Tax=Grosmannia clavigera (strain kw1407 / UAMH 11150) TaxID=655863 RepID=F0XJP5_GROCL|nr:malate dehydrogenase [Grosmannia clavigera kw1407]EFX02448.1 malate dehydrogenase [Grosmannia clavigera kw1407]